jgi:hypothetical protein
MKERFEFYVEFTKEFYWEGFFLWGVLFIIWGSYRFIVSPHKDRDNRSVQLFFGLLSVPPLWPLAVPILFLAVLASRFFGLLEMAADDYDKSKTE